MKGVLLESLSPLLKKDFRLIARMAELADALHSGCSILEGCAGSTPVPGTMLKANLFIEVN